MPRLTAPCKDCKERSLDPPCHDFCKKYLEFKEKNEAIRKAKLEQYQKDQMHVEFVVRRVSIKDHHKKRRMI